MAGQLQKPGSDNFSEVLIGEGVRATLAERALVERRITGMKHTSHGDFFPVAADIIRAVSKGESIFVVFEDGGQYKAEFEGTMRSGLAEFGDNSVYFPVICSPIGDDQDKVHYAVTQTEVTPMVRLSGDIREIYSPASQRTSYFLYVNPQQ